MVNSHCFAGFQVQSCELLLQSSGTLRVFFHLAISLRDQSGPYLSSVPAHLRFDRLSWSQCIIAVVKHRSKFDHWVFISGIFVLRVIAQHSSELLLIYLAVLRACQSGGAVLCLRTASYKVPQKPTTAFPVLVQTEGN